MARIIARTEFAAAVSQLAKERDLDPKQVLDAIKQAIIAAYRKDAKERGVELDPEIQLDVDLDPVTGEVKVYQLDNETGQRQDVTPPGFGRIAAQTAKQVIIQKIREAERETVLSDYQTKIGSLVYGMVLRFDGPTVIVDLGKTQAVMPPYEQVKEDNYQLNQRLVFYLLEIREGIRGKEIIVSRSRPELVALLFKREVPEVNSGSVEIKAIAREAGARTKLAVWSDQKGVDPVGSCVGQKGVRVQAVINELNGEKIDIIQWSEDPVQFITAAMSPAQVSSVKVNQEDKTALVVVPDEELSKAIGKEGNNVRLAAKLTGYNLDVVGESGARLEETQPAGGQESQSSASDPWQQLPTRIQNVLKSAGIENWQQLIENQDKLSQVAGLGPKSLEQINQLIAETESPASQ